MVFQISVWPKSSCKPLNPAPDVNCFAVYMWGKGSDSKPTWSSGSPQREALLGDHREDPPTVSPREALLTRTCMAWAPALHAALLKRACRALPERLLLALWAPL